MKFLIDNDYKPKSKQTLLVDLTLDNEVQTHIDTLKHENPDILTKFNENTFDESSIIMEKDYLNNLNKNIFHEVTLLRQNEDYMSDGQILEEDTSSPDPEDYALYDDVEINSTEDSNVSDYELFTSKLKHMNT